MKQYDETNYYGDGPGSFLTRLIHKFVPGAPKEVSGGAKAHISPTTVLDPREHDDLCVERRLTCGHGDWHVIQASLSEVWCHECWDTVEVEFRTLDGEEIRP